jgi:hypothetical protein
MNMDKDVSPELKQHLETAKHVLNWISSRWIAEEQVRGGVGTIPPVATLILPQAEWDRFTKQEQISLTFYTENMIYDVRTNPIKYLTIPTTAPVYSSMLNNFRQIRDGFWEIIVGRINDADKMTLMVDRSVVRGDAFWESEQDKFGVRASLFRAIS